MTRTHTHSCRVQSHINEQAARILNNILDAFQEGDSFAPVNQAVVVCERNVHHRSRHNLPVDNCRPLVDGVHAEDGRLWGVDDGRGQQGAVHASVGDGEGAACHVIDGDGAIACLLAQGIDILQCRPARSLELQSSWKTSSQVSSPSTTCMMKVAPARLCNENVSS